MSEHVADPSSAIPWEEVRRILDQYPLPVARCYRRYRNAAEPQARHDAAYYLFYVYIKYAASVAIALYLRGEARRPRGLNPRVNRDLETIVLKALEQRPESRYASAGELAADLQAARTA